MRETNQKMKILMWLKDDGSSNSTLKLERED